MGINGLLKLLESTSQKKHLSEYRGLKVAVDGYCWLHKSIFLIKSEVIENPNSTKYMTYLIRRLEALLSNHITPVIIFDGDKLPMKKEEESDRARKREETMKFAKELYDKGLDEQARQKMLEAWDINPQMAYTFIKELKKRKIEYFVAPYEADAQLAYLTKINYVDLVITEDSDMLALGCPRVLFKVDYESGYGVEISLNDLPKCRDLDFTLFSHDKFLQFCILSGCDYFKLKGIGQKTAYQFVKEKNTYKDVLTLVRNSNKACSVIPPAELEESFEKAFLTFKFQVIYCPLEKRMKYFNDINETIYTFINKYDDISFLGKIHDEKITLDIVFGVIDPITHTRFEDHKSDIINKMFNCPGVKKKEENVVDINIIQSITTSNYNFTRNNITTNNIPRNNVTRNNITSNNITTNNVATLNLAKAPSKRGRPKKNLQNNVNLTNNINKVIDINQIPEENIIDEVDLEEISAYIYDENIDENINEIESDSSEKKMKPDSIQMISMNLSQAQHNQFKRKNPFSQSQSTIEDKELNSFQHKKFKYSKDHNYKKPDTQGVTYTNINNNTSSKLDSKPDNYNEIISIKSYININKKEIIDLVEENSVKSNDTDDALNHYTEIFATYEKASDDIKRSSGDKSKLEALNFGIDNNNKMVVTYDHLSKKLFKEPSVLPEKESSNNNINDKTINDSFLFNFDEYNFEDKDDCFKKDFLKINKSIQKKEFL